MKRVYLDNAATTCLDERVLQAMIPYFSMNYGNASSMHLFGNESKEILNTSRAEIAQSIGAQPGEVFFTSGGTEANNFALKGIAFANRAKGNHIIVSSIEHDSILHTAEWLQSEGFRVTFLPVDQYGFVDPADVEKAITPATILVSVMFANNEIGTIQPVSGIGEICRAKNVFFHSDACQAFGKIPVDVDKNKIDLLTINSHKIYGPKGVGALYVRKGVKITPLLHGGGQESGLRSSTENIPGIVGFAEAARICREEMVKEGQKELSLKAKLLDFLSRNFDDFYINGLPEKSLPGLLNFSFHGLEGETIRLLLLLDEMGVAVSAGSACSSNSGASGSHVLLAIGLNQFEARGGIRLSFGRFTTKEDINYFTGILEECVQSLNAIFTH
jgi:cysteine desulfurase